MAFTVSDGRVIGCQIFDGVIVALDAVVAIDQILDGCVVNALLLLALLRTQKVFVVEFLMKPEGRSVNVTHTNMSNVMQVIQ